MRDLARNLVLYGVIGCVAAGSDALVFFLLTTFAGMDPLVANLISVPLGIIISFTLNRKFNFKVTDHAFARGAIFFGVGLFGLLISQGILYAGGAAGMNTMATKIISIVIVAIVQFLLNKLISFGIKFE